VTEAKQLTALARLHELLERNGIEYWLFGGWVVDFHAGSITRAHDDLDIAVWLKDDERTATLLAGEGWEHTPENGEDGYTVYERGSVRVEVAFLARDRHGGVYTPLRPGRAAWPDNAFETEVAELRGVRVRVMSMRALEADKAEIRDDPRVAATDRADSATRSSVSNTRRRYASRPIARTRDSPGVTRRRRRRAATRPESPSTGARHGPRTGSRSRRRDP
jgi:hypothetical protein